MCEAYGASLRLCVCVNKEWGWKHKGLVAATWLVLLWNQFDLGRNKILII